MKTESDREFEEGMSPHTVVVDYEPREQALADEIAAYGRKHGATLAAIEWGRLRAMNALKDGRSPSYAYDVGRQAIDDYLSVYPPENTSPITNSWNAAQAMGAVDLYVTATGVAGHVQYKGQWYYVRVDPANSEPQMRLGE